jgi:hypothetical protein
MKKKFALLLVVTFMAAYLTGTSRVYEEKTGQLITTHHFVIETTPSGYSIDLVSEIQDVQVHQTYQLDANLNTLSWSFENPKTKTKVNARREENNIYLTGIEENEPIKKTFEINHLPWNQTFNIGLERFALSPEQTMKFWSIGTSGPGNMKITKFKVKKKKTETITLKGQEVQAVYITMSLTGVLSIFWTGNYWYRKSDGTFLRYKGKNKPGAPVTIMELISEGRGLGKNNGPSGAEEDRK